ncbi:hypothetical protein DFH06DRAFT_1184667 [Mycena polygramma]|nr:hypothetical protein DFH06DRAFT_1184667 [Mycena polygramma]
MMTQTCPMALPKEEYNEKSTLDGVANDVADTLHRVAELWFEDDSLILRAEDSIFRISKGILMARSPVFKAMIGLSHSGQESMYGCPMIQLHHSAAEVTSFLFFMPPPAKASFEVVIGVLRLAHEYDVKYLLRRALVHFEAFFPSTLDGDCTYDQGCDSESALSCNLVALRIALEVGAVWNLPSIMYECCTFSLAEILDNANRRDLPKDDERTLILSHQNQAKLGMSLVTSFLYAQPSGRCKFAAKCNLGKLVWLGKVEAWRKEGRDSVPLEFWDESDWAQMDGDFCEGCLASFQESYARGRVALWEALPSVFGLPGWEDLNEAQIKMFRTNE